MAGKCRRYLQFVSEANPIEGEPVPLQTQQIKVAAFCGQVYPCQCSPLETINRETCINFLLYYCYSIVNNQQPMLYKYTAQAREQAPQWCKHYFFILQNIL